MPPDLDLDDIFAEETWPKTCGCSHKISEDDWERLPYVGIQEGTDNIPSLELRNCARCSSTLAIVVPRDFAQ